MENTEKTQLTPAEKFQRGKNYGCMVLVIAFLIYAYFIRDQSPAAIAPSQREHTCSYCGDSFKGNGWSSVSGEQFQPSDGSGSYCSQKCAYDSQPRKWK